MQQLERQTRAVESIRNMLNIYFILAIIVGAFLVVAVLASSNSGL